MIIDGYVADQIIKGQISSEVKPILNTERMPSDEWLAEHDKQIRADAIDECIKAVRNHHPDIVKMLEQIKEQTES